MPEFLPFIVQIINSPEMAEELRGRGYRVDWKALVAAMVEVLASTNLASGSPPLNAFFNGGE